MKKITTAVFLVILLISTAFIYKSTPLGVIKGYSLTGYITGYPDGTKLYLDDQSDDDLKTIDSVSILNGQFKFAGVISGKFLKVLIHTSDFKDYYSFWLENSLMTFKAKKGQLHNAMITGSKTQVDEDKWDAIARVINKKIDSLNLLLTDKTISTTRKKEITDQFESLNRAEAKEVMTFVKSNPASIISADLLNIYSSVIGRDKTVALFNSFPSENKKTLYGKNILQFITLNKNLKIGDHYADFSQLTPNGNKIKASNYNGKVLLIDFWASWCAPCRSENPELVETYNNFKTKGFEIISVSLDNKKQDWINAIKKDGLTWPNVSELNGDKNTAALMYGISGIPDNFLIDKNGVILARNLRGQKLRDKLIELFK